jgi:YD repeat-containing protein
MHVKIGQTSFDRVRYDAEGDVLYLHRADPASAVDFHGAEEGHGLRYDARGRLVGVTLLNARWSLERDGEVRITFPDGGVLVAGPDELTPVLAPA